MLRTDAYNATRIDLAYHAAAHCPPPSVLLSRRKLGLTRRKSRVRRLLASLEKGLPMKGSSAEGWISIEQSEECNDRGFEVRSGDLGGM